MNARSAHTEDFNNRRSPYTVQSHSSRSISNSQICTFDTPALTFHAVCEENRKQGLLSPHFVASRLDESLYALPGFRCFSSNDIRAITGQASLETITGVGAVEHPGSWDASARIGHDPLLLAAEQTKLPTSALAVSRR